MKKLWPYLHALGMILRNPRLIRKVLEDNDQWLRYNKKKHGLQHRLKTLNLLDIFPGFSMEIEPVAFLDGGSLPTDLALLKAFASTFDNCSYFEIGTWRGESAAVVAQEAESCVTLNLSDEELEQLGMSPEYIQMHAFFSKKHKNITHLKGNSLTFDFSNTGKFDLVFIDGDHHYEAVKSDTQNILNHLIHEKSVVVWHDYAYDPEHVRHEVLAGILDGVPNELHPYLYHVSNTKCAVLLRQELPAEHASYPVRPDKFFNIRITSSKI